MSHVGGSSVSTRCFVLHLTSIFFLDFWILDYSFFRGRKAPELCDPQGVIAAAHSTPGGCEFYFLFGFFWIFRAGRTLVCFWYFVAGPVVKLRLRRPRALGDRALRKKELYVPPSGLAKEILNNTQ